ncbi:hypothetical protein TrVE_jg6644 [Triparma verrucosa]|uniref:Tocopherol cyclase n=1 Tax=Triparma verrucosa TaxID=1606542 RepID=A0A9W7BYX2_9STRA|nr:hypothetical protein TrVE_jg6644 [Triparma verrucosa]
MPLKPFLATPHSHFHYPSPTDRNTPHTTQKKNWFEGWYYRITLPPSTTSSCSLSFVVIVSLEHNQDPAKSATAVQVMGPADSYFWQTQSCISDFRSLGPNQLSSPLESGYYNISENFMDVKLVGASPGTDPSPSLSPSSSSSSSSSSCHDFHFNISSIVPLCGWGDHHSGQKSTAGWLAKFSLFDPHWQITMSSASASGTIAYDNQTYSFSDAKFYAEKNWGSIFPEKWYWIQSNSFSPPFSDLCLTAGGGVRRISLPKSLSLRPFSSKTKTKTEDLGLVGIHYDSKFYEFVPWTGEMGWEVNEWGRWKFNARSKMSGGVSYECEVLATCDVPGTTIRAPTTDGMQFFCRDSLDGVVNLSLWELDQDGQRIKAIILNATSNSCGVEVGGDYSDGPWQATSRMSRVLKTLVKIPYLRRNLQRRKKAATANSARRKFLTSSSSLLASFSSASAFAAPKPPSPSDVQELEEIRTNPQKALKLTEKEFKTMIDRVSIGKSYKTSYMDKNAWLVYYTKGFDGVGRPSIEQETDLELLANKQAYLRNEMWLMIDDLRFGDATENQVQKLMDEFLKTILN